MAGLFPNGTELSMSVVNELATPAGRHLFGVISESAQIACHFTDYSGILAHSCLIRGADRN